MGRALWIFVVIFSMCRVAVAASAPAQADLSAKALSNADSLYAGKQYTQALERYQALDNAGHYSPAMFLKMAHIEEGLDHLGESLFYLNRYYLASDDAQALKKMEELAKKNNLMGYETDESSHVLAWLQGQYLHIAWVLLAAGVFLLSLMYYLRVRKKLNPSFVGILLILVLTLLFLDVNFNKAPERAIIAQPLTYLMEGPSSASSVLTIVGEGHQLEIKGKKDVWLKVRWKDEDAYVKENLVRVVRL